MQAPSELWLHLYNLSLSLCYDVHVFQSVGDAWKFETKQIETGKFQVSSMLHPSLLATTLQPKDFVLCVLLTAYSRQVRIEEVGLGLRDGFTLGHAQQ